MALFNVPLGESFTPELCHKMAHCNVSRLRSLNQANIPVKGLIFLEAIRKSFLSIFLLKQRKKTPIPRDTTMSSENNTQSSTSILPSLTN